MAKRIDKAQINRAKQDGQPTAGAGKHARKPRAEELSFRSAGGSEIAPMGFMAKLLRPWRGKH